MSKEYRTPDGTKIVGTKELIPGVALISGIEDDGTPVYSGSTDVDWDGQITAHPDGKTILYVCDDGEEWTFDQLIPVPDEEEDD